VVERAVPRPALVMKIVSIGEIVCYRIAVYAVLLHLSMQSRLYLQPLGLLRTREALPSVLDSMP